LLETNGSQDISQVNPETIKILDLKCPSSGEHKQNDLDNLRKLSPHDQVKFVIGDRQDYEFARNLVNSFPEKGVLASEVLFSSVFSEIDLSDLASWIIEDSLDVRLQIQLHKIIWDPKMRGV